MFKQCVWVDVSKAHVEVCFSVLRQDQEVAVRCTKTFSNRSGGWKALLRWANRLRQAEVSLCWVMEATGVYYEGLAYYLRDAQQHVSVILPNVTRKYIQSLNIKTKTDRVEAAALARMGLERKLKVWTGMLPIMLQIRHLCRERTALQGHLVAISNQLHAHKHAHQPQAHTLSRLQTLIHFLQKQIREIEQQIHACIAQEEDLKKRVENVCTIKGVNVLTAIIIISEANGFEPFENKAQLVSYAGYDVVEHQSGTSVRGKTKISKKGNSHTRRALHYPALSAARHDAKCKNLYERIRERNPKVKMVGMVAVQRKILVLIYTLYKNNTPYDPHFTTSINKNRQMNTSACAA